MTGDTEEPVDILLTISPRNQISGVDYLIVTMENRA